MPAKSDILSHPPPCGLMRSAGSARKRNGIAKTSTFGRLSTQAQTFHKQIEQQPNDVRTEFRGCSLKQKISLSHFLIHIKSHGRRGARGEEPRGVWARFLLPVIKKLKFQTKPRDSENFKHHQLTHYACNFRYLIPPSLDGFRRP